jgi:hypothetical protein
MNNKKIFIFKKLINNKKYMISKLNLKKNLKKNEDIYYLEIIIPYLLNNINYKIYGSEGFIHYGRISSYTSLNHDNILVIPIDKIQTICISIKIISNKKNIEYFDIFNMNNLLIKNIKINVTRKNKIYSKYTITDLNIENFNKNEEDSDEDEEDSDEDEEDTDEDTDEDSEEDEDTEDVEKKNIKNDNNEKE